MGDKQLTWEQVERWRENFAIFLHDRVFEIRQAAEQKVAICDLALSALRQDSSGGVLGETTCIGLAQIMSHSSDDDKRRLAREVLRLAATQESRSEVLCDRAYINGLQAGFTLGYNNDRAGFDSAIESYERELRVSRADPGAPVKAGFDVTTALESLKPEPSVDYAREIEVLNSAIRCLTSEWGPSWSTPDGIDVLKRIRAKIKPAKGES